MDPDIARAFEATWPPAEVAQDGALATGRGEGAGGRVSSTRALRPDWTGADLSAAEARHAGWNQPPLYRVMEDDTVLVQALAARGYTADKPTAVMAADVAALTAIPVPEMTAFTIWPPLAIQRQIWDDGGLSPARQRVMARAPGPKTALLGRGLDRAAAAGFVACDGRVAVLHALEVLPQFRRHGLGAAMVRQAAQWAAAEGASRLALAVTVANAPAVGLYHALGFAEVARYQYFSR